MHQLEPCACWVQDYGFGCTRYYSMGSLSKLHWRHFWIMVFGDWHCCYISSLWIRYIYAKPKFIGSLKGWTFNEYICLELSTIALFFVYPSARIKLSYCGKFLDMFALFENHYWFQHFLFVCFIDFELERFKRLCSEGYWIELC